ncbi:hypothetical protein WK28_18700 [Burkholderia vietnamiensis]|nr:hypothetical protein WK28_18700 [Burkholderia vietnamiensis]
MCGEIGVDFDAVSDPVHTSDSHINMTFSSAEECLADRLIKRVRVSVAADSPESFMFEGDEAQKLGIQVHKSFVCSNRCWAVSVALSGAGYKLTESLEA